MYNELDTGIGGPGPVIEGTWVNKNTGTTVQVRDNLISDTGMIVMLSDGRMIDMDEFSRDYIQTDDDTAAIITTKPKGGSKPNKPSMDTDLLFDGMGDNSNLYADPVPADPADPMVEFGDDMIISGLINGESGISTSPKATAPITVNKVARSKNYETINKLFSKVATTPSINFDIHWDEYPSKEVEMLINFLDVDKNEIGEYLYDKYFNKKAIVAAIDDAFLK